LAGGGGGGYHHVVVNARFWAKDGQHCTALWRDVLITIWHQSVELHAIHRLHEGVEELLRRHSAIALLGVSRPHVTMVPGTAERRLLADLLRDHGTQLRCIGSVILGDGFVSAAKRTVLSTISMVARQPCPLRMFADLSTAAGWMAPRLGPPQEPRDLLRAVEDLERAYDDFLAS
jgi:hypothetical protein